MIGYDEVSRFVHFFCPQLRSTRRRNLSLLTYSILCRRSLCLSELARGMPLAIYHLYRVKRLWRFLSNRAVSPLTFVPLFLRRLPPSPGKRRPLILDYTALGPFRVLVAAIGYRGRAFPLAFIPILWGRLESSLNQVEEALLLQLGSPEPVVIADRGFGRASLFRFLVERGWPFVIRISGDGMMEWKGQKLRVRDLALERGQQRFLKGICYHQGQRVSINLALAWQGKEPWYLATSLSGAREAVKLYARRMWIEEMFRDFKSRLGARAAGVREEGRLSRLLLGLALAYWFLGLTGLALPLKPCKRLILSQGKASFTWLALQWLLLSHPPPPLLAYTGRGQTGVNFSCLVTSNSEATMALR